MQSKTKKIDEQKHDPYAKYQGINHSGNNLAVAANTQIISDVYTRTPFGREDYNAFRPNEAVPTKFYDQLKACRNVYKTVGVVRDVMDLMIDFVSDGFDIRHPSPEGKIFFEKYMTKTRLPNKVREFAKHILIDHNVVVRKIMAKINVPGKRLLKAEVSEGMEADIDLKVADVKTKTEERLIPWDYLFVDPLSLTWKSVGIPGVSTKKVLVIKIHSKVVDMIRKPKTKEEKDIIKELPKEIVDSVKSGQNEIRLDMEKIHYAAIKKDSWEDWATPFLTAVLPDIYFKEKLRQADVSALDGVINVIRIWKLGNAEMKIHPTPDLMSKLLNILNANTGGGALDLVWDDMISLEEHYPPVDKILGSGKYEQVNTDILVGLGIPEVLIGGKGANFSNSSIQLKTVLQRLHTLRTEIIDWLLPDIKHINQVMGFEGDPVIKFKNNLQDDIASRQLLVGLMDRGIVSSETVLEYFNENKIIERTRTEDDEKFFDIDIKRTGPFSRDAGETGDVKNGKNGKKGTPGRPPNTKDITRDERTPNPVSAIDSVNTLFAKITDKYLQDNGLSNARQLTSEQRSALDELKITTLASMSNNGNIGVKNENMYKILRESLNDFTKDTGQEPTQGQRNTILGLAWAGNIRE
jgi:hypothetical protein